MVVDVNAGVLLAEVSYKLAPGVLSLTQQYRLEDYDEKYNVSI